MSRQHVSALTAGNVTPASGSTSTSSPEKSERFGRKKAHMFMKHHKTLQTRSAEHDTMVVTK
ncbi:hypothetical protein HYFRA_00004463 [Hymenoscyphus fraxineus]|uniref:Uncharacterized protein n=1 Tax=Hymenoscyphus fraxineus TaxID=746836 RepID=A0A9N9PUI0_9HELO|nr:hypothetical protein HYFRA_00004463 [Hymenoscyphus fraxineus]